jgi:hypothetical protein
VVTLQDLVLVPVVHHLVQEVVVAQALLVLGHHSVQEVV